MDIEIALEDWCDKKGIDCSKIDDDLWDKVVNLIEQSIDDYLRDNKDKVLGDWTFMIEQELPDHPEWLKENTTKGGSE